MTKTASFVKGHGLGNDFVIVSEAELGFELLSEHAKLICDRRRGLGADGVLVYRRHSSGDAYMQILNSDGSEPEMCGNGLRLFARYLVEEHSFPESFNVQTLAGCRSAKVLSDGRVQVGMGPADFVSEPDGLSIQVGDHGRLLGTHVSMGNPHFVVFREDVPLENQTLASMGQELQDHPAFLEGVNLSSASISSDGQIKVSVFERGCGLTQACGTAACAVAAAALRTGRVPGQHELSVHLPGGPLSISVEPNDWNIYMTGAAQIVARGQLDLSALGAF